MSITMKRTRWLLSILVVVLAFPAFRVFGYYIPPSERNEATTVAYASQIPVIDGEIDAVWETTPKFEALYEMHPDFAHGYAKVLWREDALYLLAVVYDTTIDNIPANSTTNLVNFWVSETKSEAERYGILPGDWYLPVNHAGNTYSYEGFSMEGRAEYTAKVYPKFDETSAYIVEVKVVIQTEGYTYAAGSTIGFGISIDDDADGDNVRDSYCTTENGGAYWTTPSVLTALTLVMEVDNHEHTFADVISENALKTEATCQSLAVYYQSCAECGKIGKNTFTHGETAEHRFEGGTCQVCGEEEMNETMVTSSSSATSTTLSPSSPEQPVPNFSILWIVLAVVCAVVLAIVLFLKRNGKKK